MDQVELRSCHRFSREEVTPTKWMCRTMTKSMNCAIVQVDRSCHRPSRQDVPTIQCMCRTSAQDARSYQRPSQKPQVVPSTKSTGRITDLVDRSYHRPSRLVVSSTQWIGPIIGSYHRPSRWVWLWAEWIHRTILRVIDCIIEQVDESYNPSS